MEIRDTEVITICIETAENPISADDDDQAVAETMTGQPRTSGSSSSLVAQ